MPTLREHMLSVLEALRVGRNPPPGPPVLIEAAGSQEVLLPRTADSELSMPWQTMRIEARQFEMEQARIEGLTALQPLVADDSRVVGLQKAGDNPAANICIGRAKRNDVVINDVTVSSIHAQVEEGGDQLCLLDCGSSNGTFVNKVRVEPSSPVALRHGDCVRLGRRIFYYLGGRRFLQFLEIRIVKRQRARG